MAKRKQRERPTEACNGDWILRTYRSLQEKIRSSVASPSQLAHEDIQFPLPKQINDYVFEVCKPEGRPSVDIVFFHGLQLEYPGSKDPHITTWMSRNKSELWLKWLVEDEYLRIPNARIFTICYDASLRTTDDTGRMDMYLTVENLIYSLTESRVRVGQDGCPVVLVGHCFGGLLMKELCVQTRSFIGQHGRLNVEKLENFLRSVKGFFTYSSPHHGMRLADRSTCSGKGPLFKDLSTHNAIASRRNEDFRNLRKEKGWKAFGVLESLPVTLEGLGFEGIVVAEASARHDVDGFYTIPDVNHFDVCRPKSTTCNSFRLLRTFVSDVVNEDKAGVSTNLLTHDKLNMLVDIDSRVKDVVKKLKTHQRLGIVGFGGMGKTTLAKAVYDKISGSFEYVCFLEDVQRKMAKEESQEGLRKQIWKELMWNGRSVGKSFNWNKLKRKKVLICLDDAKHESQVKVMLQSDDFSEESRVIVTSRHRDCFRNQKFEILDAKGLDLRNSETLFRLHAFGQREIPLTSEQRMSSFVTSFAEKCQGHPLALKVAGGYLSACEDEETWAGALQTLSNAQSLSGDFDDELWSIVTVKGLAPGEYEMFLDVATCFHGKYLEEIEKVWATCSHREERFTGRLRWKNLLNRCLVSTDKQGRIKMHDLLRELGRKEAGRSRVCSVSDIMKLREEDKATLKVLKVSIPLRYGHGDHAYKLIGRPVRNQINLLGFVWKLPALEYLEIQGKRYFRRCKAFNEEVEALRHLEHIFCDLEGVPKPVGKLSALQYLRFSYYPFLTEFSEGVGQLQALRYLHIHRSADLRPFLDSIGNLRALKRLEFMWCDLEGLPDSIRNLQALEHLEIKYCRYFKSLPDSIWSLQALEHLEINSCSNFALRDNIENLPPLKHLEIICCNLGRDLPNSIGNLRALEHLEFENCKFKALPDSIENLQALKWLRIQGIEVGDFSFDLSQSFDKLIALKHLELVEVGLKALPDNIGNFQNLTYLAFISIREIIFPEGVRELRKLETLIMTLNDGKLPEFVCQLEGLRHLELDGRIIDEPISFPHTSGHLHKLEKLIFRHMYHNTSCKAGFREFVIPDFREFVIPDFLCHLTALQHLEFDECVTLIKIPEFIAQLPNLRHLKFQVCPLLEVPPSSLLEKLQALQQLTIWECGFIRRAPKWATKHRVRVDVVRASPAAHQIWPISRQIRSVGSNCSEGDSCSEGSEGDRWSETDCSWEGNSNSDSQGEGWSEEDN